MEIRLQGTKNECAMALEKLKQVLKIKSISCFYENRRDKLFGITGELTGRVYVEVKG